MLLLKIRLEGLLIVAGARVLCAALNAARIGDENDLAPVKAAPVDAVHCLGDAGEGVLVE